MSPKKEEREPTFDLEKGVGLFRWGDDKRAVKKAYPHADWTIYEPLYLMRRVYLVEEMLEVAGTMVRGVIDPGRADGMQVVVLYPADESVLATLAAKLGMPGGMAMPGDGDDDATWDVGKTHVDLRNWPSYEMSVHMARPKDTA